ncbi:thiol-disulfide oxidoreductase DCC [Senna tora]|uniref:Thiol-disulfide oxidoreductase DCC n=1 Tax=Senna tora TaxID=362788 RepID=A0A834X535_9FABA|nr:thiol-disulfide oxidoreductase DCC [Senna tora]
MALRGAAFAVASAASASSSLIGRRRSPFILPIPHRLTLKSHSRTFLPIRIHQPGFRCQIRALSQAAAEPAISRKEEEEEEEQSPKDWKIKMLYDGDCPLCMREVNMLRERNKNYGTIKFIDISSDDYSPQENQGLDYETVMGRIHAILSDGTVVTDVEAFRRLYEQVGLGWVYAITKYKPIGTLADAIYGVWAKYRLQITGRPPMEEILEARKKKGEVCKDSNACKM